MAVAHKFSEKARTSDVLISETVDFAGLLLSEPVLHGLKNSGFERPSPIQLKAIPLGRCGLDLIVQAKSGTGKTCVFTVIALENIQVTAPSTQVLVLAPTREIAIQIWEVIGSLGSAISGLQCHTFIGGLPLHEDKKKLQLCHIAVGTPGRIQNLIEHGCLKTDSIRLFILDEADKLLEESFQEQINWIYSALPDNKQMVALSATYPEYMAEHLTVYMRNPTFIRLNISDPALLGIKQYYTSIPSHPLPHRVFEAKTAAVVKLLSSVSFHQCLIFSNMQTRAQNLESELTSRGWPTTCIAGSLDQKDRITAMAKLKSYKCRVLISTDLTSRGIDADRVNLVINLDVPKDHETYLHRIGRAGRFGSYGAGVTIISEGQEMLDMQNIEHQIATHILPLPDPVPSDLVKRQLQVNLDDVVSTEQLITRSQPGDLPSIGTVSSPHNDKADIGAGSKHEPCSSALGDVEVSSGPPVMETQLCGDLSIKVEAVSALADASGLADTSALADVSGLADASGLIDVPAAPLWSSSSDSKDAVCSEQHSSRLHSIENVPADHEHSQQSDAPCLPDASATQVDTVASSSDASQHREGVNVDKSEVTELCAGTNKIQLPESESVQFDGVQGDSAMLPAKTEEENHSAACPEAPEGAWDSGLGLEKDSEEQTAEAKFASQVVIRDCDQVNTIETSDCISAENTKDSLQGLAGETPDLKTDHTALSQCQEGNGTVDRNQEKVKKSDSDQSHNIKSKGELLCNSESIEKLSNNLEPKAASTKNADSKLVPEPEKPDVVKKYSKTRSTAAIWSSMLSSELFVEETEVPESKKDSSLSSELSSVEKHPPGIAAKLKAGGKDGKQQSWDSELATYIASRSKVNRTRDDESADKENSSSIKEVANRPKNRARRRLGTENRKESAFDKWHTEQNELASGGKPPRESGSGVAELQAQRLPRVNGLMLNQAVLPSQDAGEGMVNDQTDARARRHGEELQTSATKSSSQTPRQENEDAGNLTSKPPASSCSRRRQVKCPEAGRESHCDGRGFEMQPVFNTDHRRSVTQMPKMSSSSGAVSKNSVSCLTYSSALQDYERYLEKKSTPITLTALEIVQRTFRGPEKVEKSQLEQISTFLKHFHAEIKVKSQNSSTKVRFDAARSESNKQPTVVNQLSGKEKGVSVSENASVGGGHWDGGDHALDSIDMGKTLSKGNSQSPNTIGLNCVAESKSSDVNSHVKTQSSVRREEKVANKSVNNSARNVQRPLRYRPMAVCGPATEHIFGFKNTTQKASVTVPEDVPLVSGPVLPHDENTDHGGPETGRQGDDSFAPDQHGIQDALTKSLSQSSSGAQEGEVATVQKHDKYTRPCREVQLQAQGKDAIPKKKLAEKTSKRDNLIESSDESSSTLSSSTSSNGDSSEEELNEKNSMCFQNYYADESTVKGRKKKLSSTALTRKREQEEKMRRKAGRMPSASFQAASKEQQWGELHQRGRSTSKDACYKMAPADAACWAPTAPHVWQPYMAQRNYYDYYSTCKPDKNGSESRWSYPYPNSSPSYMHWYHQNVCPPTQTGLSSGGWCHPCPGYPSYQYQVPSYEGQYYPSHWQQCLPQHHNRHHPFHGSGAGRPAADHMPAEELANVQQGNAQRLQQYIRKMARFYARFSKRDS